MPTIRQVTTPQAIAKARLEVSQVFADEKVRDYIVDVVRATRPGSEGHEAVQDLIDNGAVREQPFGWMQLRGRMLICRVVTTSHPTMRNR